jgi:hypothetical protein
VVGSRTNSVMKVGDLVKAPPLVKEFPDEPHIGIVVEVIDHDEVPPVVRVLWDDGTIEKDWVDELERVNDEEQL